MKRTLSFFHPYPKYLQIADTMRKRILTEMQPGDWLPSEVTISSKFGLSRKTMQQALEPFEPLENVGPMQRTPGQGSFVSMPSAVRQAEQRRHMVEDFMVLGLRPYANLLQKPFVKADAWDRAQR